MFKNINESFEKRFKQITEEPSVAVKKSKHIKESVKDTKVTPKVKETITESPSYDMRPQYDTRQSFYGKARVDDNNGELTLYSYNTPVAKISNGKVELLPKWDFSSTTLRHTKEFLKQNGFEATSLSQMRKNYL
jgi:hypothetical protein